MSDDLEKMNEIIEQFNERISSMIEAMDALSNAQTSLIDKTKNTESSLDNLTSVTNNTGKAIVNKTKLEQDETEKLIEEKANYRSSVNAAKTAVASFADTLVSGEKGFSVFSGALNSAGDAALSLGQALGPIGTILGTLLKATTLVVDKQFEQADAVFEARNELFKFAGSSTITSNELLDLGQNLGFTAKQLNSIINPLKTMGPSLRSLGDTAGEGAKRFLEMADIEDEVRKKFIRMGVMPEELLESQATYINLQRLAGNQASLRLKTDKEIQAESLQYVESLKVLSELTGEDAEAIKKRQEAALNDFRIQARITQMNAEAAELERSGAAEDRRRAEELRQNAENMRTSIQIAAALSPELADQAKSLILTGGTITDFTANLAVAGVDVQKFSRSMEEGDPDAMLNFLQDVMDKTSGQAVKFSETLGFLSDEHLNILGISRGSMDLVTKYLNEGRTLAETVARVRSDIEEKTRARMDEEPSIDPLADAQAKLITTQMDLAAGFDNIIQETNPLIKGFNGTTIAATALGVAATAAATALGALTVSSGIRNFLPDVGGNNKPGRVRMPKARIAGISGLAGTVVGTGYSLFEGYSDHQEINRQQQAGEITEQEATSAKTVNIAETSGQAIGVALGAALGSIIPGAGTLIGASIGGWLGGVAGEKIGGFIGEKINERRNDNLELDNVVPENNSVNRIPENENDKIELPITKIETDDITIKTRLDNSEFSVNDYIDRNTVHNNSSMSLLQSKFDMPEIKRLDNYTSNESADNNSISGVNAVSQENTQISPESNKNSDLLLGMIVQRLDDVIYRLENSNEIQSLILMRTSV